MAGFQPMPPQNYGQNQGIMLVPIQGENGVQMYPVAAGNSVFLADFSGGMAWLKSTDQYGFPQPIRKFVLKEIIPQPENKADSVSRAEFDELKKMIAGMTEQLSGGVEHGKSRGNAK